MTKPILCIDFDGVLHLYSQGWLGPTAIYDPPTPGALEFVQEAQKHFELIVYSTRARTIVGRHVMLRWLSKHGFPELEITFKKPHAFVTLDDRAIQFTGTFPDPQTLLEFKPWNRRNDAESSGGPMRLVPPTE